MTDKPTVAVVLLSYNRPQMLDLAFRSIKGADQIILADDGSDVFNAFHWSAERDTDHVLLEQRSVEDRMTQPRLGLMVNQALSLVHADIVTYLCDDDLFAPGWLDALRAALPTERSVHVARGHWRVFDDPLTGGKPLASAPPDAPLARLDWRKMTTGNFGHRIECYTSCGLRWSERTVAVHDDTFLWNLHHIHDLRRARNTRVLAGWRREHQWNMANYTAHSDYSLGAENVLRRGALE